MPLKFPFSSFFIFNLISSSLFTFSSYSWLGVWTGLEYNLISFIPLLMINPSPSSTESSVKYFLIQAISSALLLFSFLLMNVSPLSSPISNLIIILSLSVKLGLAPFHQWVPNVASSLSWPNLLLLLTWQKLAPLALLVQYLNSLNTKFIMLMAALSALLGGLGGLNQTQMRSILAFSSIGHMGWTISAALLSTLNTMLYLVIYSLTLSALMMLLNLMQMGTLSSSFNLISLSPQLASIIFMLFLSLAGLPPFLGFMPKAMILNSIIESSMFYISIPLIMGSLMNLYYYLTFILTYLFTQKVNPKTRRPTLSSWNSFLSLLPIILLPALLPLV